MYAVIDFNGYFFCYNQYRIKEYSLYLIHEKTNEIVSNYFYVSKPLISWEQLHKEDRENYKKYFKTHGIHWNVGSKNAQKVKHELKLKLGRSSKIYVRDLEQHKLLVNYFESEFPALKLTDLGFTFEITKGTTCAYHAKLWKYNCANDNVIKMVKWLIKPDPRSGGIMKSVKKRFIADFSSYQISKKLTVIKEFSALAIDKRTIDDYDLHLVAKSPFKTLKDLDPYYWLSFIGFERIYGIEWQTGSTDLTEVPHILTKYFKNATHIYVRDMENQIVLEKFIGEKYNFIRLDELGFSGLPNLGTDCPYHFKKESICVVNTSKDMLTWLKNDATYNVSWRDEVVNTVSYQHDDKVDVKQDYVSKMKEKIARSIFRAW